MEAKSFLDKPAKGGIIKLTSKMGWFDKLTMFLSELFGTAILVFVCCLGCVPGMSGEISIFQGSFSAGLAVMVTIFLFGHISGAHVNPVTTVTAVIIGYTPLSLAPFYILGEMSGAVLGYKLLELVTPAEYRLTDVNGTSEIPGVCVTIPSPKITTGQALGVEIMLTLVLVFAICAAWDSRNARLVDAVPLKFGFLIAVLYLAGNAYTGASMNPAKSFAPALWNGQWKDHWIYWVGPLTSAFIGSILYRIVFSREKLPLSIDQ